MSKKSSTWQDKCLTAARNTKTGAILRAALERNDEGAPTFGHRASITSDGFIIADFTSQSGEFHMGAFVGSFTELTDNVNRLAAHCKLTDDETKELDAVVARWAGCGTQSDYRHFSS